MKKRDDTKPKAAAGGRRRRYEAIAGDAGRVAEPEVSAVSGGPRVIGATEAARNFSDLINRVSYRGEAYIVERGGRPMCELRPVGARRCTGAELRAALAKLTKPPEEFLSAVEEAARSQAVVSPSPWEK